MVYGYKMSPRRAGFPPPKPKPLVQRLCADPNMLVLVLSDIARRQKDGVINSEDICEISEARFKVPTGRSRGILCAMKGTRHSLLSGTLVLVRSGGTYTTGTTYKLTPKFFELLAQTQASLSPTVSPDPAPRQK